jgi:glyoxylase-like metal-dependent hydrolase (beta-lactamase superfamily II)
MKRAAPLACQLASLLAFSLAFLLGACAPVAAPIVAPFPADARVSPEDGYLYEAVAIAPRVHAFMSREPFQVQPLGNVTAIEQSDGFVLVDSGGSPAAAERIVAFLGEIADKPVKAIVLTHWHGDHVLGLRTLLARWPDARTISTAQTRASLMSAETARFMPTGDAANDSAIQANLAGGVAFLQGRSGQADLTDEERRGYAQAARVLAQHAQDLRGAARIAPGESFADRMVIEDSVAPAEIAFLGRANTDGDAVVWLPRQRVLVTGDIVVSPIPFGFGSYPESWSGVLERLKAYDFATLVPGHGRAMQDRAYLDRLIGLIAEMRRQTAPLAAEGLSLEDVRARTDFSAQAAAFTGGSPWLGRWFNAYWTQPFVASAYKEARGEPIVQGGG